MKSIIINICLLLFVSFSYGQASCDIKIQGGVDNWPWNVAQPFPWTTIQGIWKLSSDSSDMYFRLRVTNSNSVRKLLKIEKIANGNCVTPVANGVGYINSDEKNVVRMIMSDKNLRYQLKLAMFDTKDLANVAGAPVCDGEEQVLAASMQVIGRMGKLRMPLKAASNQAENMILTKVTGTLDSICKRPTSN